jgi:hypothetical protein
MESSDRSAKRRRYIQNMSARPRPLLTTPRSISHKTPPFSSSLPKRSSSPTQMFSYVLQLSSNLLSPAKVGVPRSKESSTFQNMRLQHSRSIRVGSTLHPSILGTSKNLHCGPRTKRHKRAKQTGGARVLSTVRSSATTLAMTSFVMPSSTLTSH